MDNKIKTLVIGTLTLFTLLLAGCKTNNWGEWKMQNELWLESNKSQPGVRVTESGLQYKIIADPTPQDACPNLNSTIICDYTVKLINGYQVSGGNNVTLSLASTIAGFAEGCHKIHNNGDIEFYIPAYLGYDKVKFDSNDYGQAEGNGTEGTQGYIPPYSTLIYVVHICGVLGD
jgi:FKBP-type peptidyl-prolyl cis-trans isomerase